eukprot:7741913-Pyramimonas_sp.AAC.1
MPPRRTNGAKGGGLCPRGGPMARGEGEYAPAAPPPAQASCVRAPPLASAPAASCVTMAATGASIRPTA